MKEFSSDLACFRLAKGCVIASDLSCHLTALRLIGSPLEARADSRCDFAFGILTDEVPRQHVALNPCREEQ